MVIKYLETEMGQNPAANSMDAAVPLPLVALIIAHVLEKRTNDDGGGCKFGRRVGPQVTDLLGVSL